MRLESRALLAVLLEHHRFRVYRQDGTVPSWDECRITYGDLCSQAGVPHLTRNPGVFLAEVAAWCFAHNPRLPPINALAVNAETDMPGDNYDLAPGCSLLNWPAERDAVIRCRDYPEAI
jgi:hypothetical protein